MLKKIAVITLGFSLMASTVNVHAIGIKTVWAVGAVLETYITGITAKKLFWDKNPNKDKILLTGELIFSGLCAFLFWRLLMRNAGKDRKKGPGPVPESFVFPKEKRKPTIVKPKKKKSLMEKSYSKLSHGTRIEETRHGNKINWFVVHDENGTRLVSEGAWKSLQKKKKLKE